MLEGRNLSFRYGRKLPWLFSELTLQVERGERLGLAGPSGIGKSTLARILAGYIKPIHGSVSVEGKACNLKDQSSVQLLFQHPELAVNPRWRCRDILNEGESVGEDLLQQLEINTSWLDRYPHELSGGELQRICLARALAQGSEYLICDEMTSMVDALTQARIWKAVLDWSELGGMGLLIISHDLVLLQRLCGRIIFCVQDADSSSLHLVSSS